MDIINQLFSFIIHIDAHMLEIVNQFGSLTYVFLFLIIFAETGLVVTPFLPGDSLLFAVGALSAIGSMNLLLTWVVLLVAAFLGDTVNYWIGHFFGKKIVSHPLIPINQSHIDKTEEFYAKHGGKTIILARFVPIVRTFAPFVAGIGGMHYGKFISYNIIGAVVWVSSITLAGYFFGNIPIVKDNFSVVVIAIVAISVLPMAYEALKDKAKPRWQFWKKFK